MLKNDVEEIVGKYCDGTWTNLDNAYFVDSANPRKLADELVEYIESLLTKRTPDAAPRPPFLDRLRARRQ